MTDEDLGVARMLLDGAWELDMIGDVTRAYVQVYAAGYFLFSPNERDLPSDTPERERGRYSYPWQGGFSAVNFFRSIYAHIPLRHRPEVLRITYASPGFIELIGYTSAISFVIGAVTKNASKIVNVHNEIQRAIRDRELNKLEVRKLRAQTRFIEGAYAQLVDAMELPEAATEKLREATQADRWGRLKILLAIARRIQRVASFERENTLSLEPPKGTAAALADESSGDRSRKIQAKLDAPNKALGAPELPALLASAAGDDDEN